MQLRGRALSLSVVFLLPRYEHVARALAPCRARDAAARARAARTRGAARPPPPWWENHPFARALFSEKGFEAAFGGSDGVGTARDAVACAPSALLAVE